MKISSVFTYILIIIYTFIFNLDCFAYTNIKTQYIIGETFIYNIEVFNIKVAEQITTLLGEEKINGYITYHYQTTIKTLPVIDKLYKLNDKIDTYIDKKTFSPVYIKTLIKEGDWENDIEIKINPKIKQFIYKDKFGTKKIKYKDKFFGLISLILYLRTIKPKNEEQITLAIHNKRRLKTLKLKAYYTKDTVFSKFNKDQNSIKYTNIEDEIACLYVSKDKNNLPYRFTSIRVPIASYGYITFVNNLKSYTDH